MLKAGELFGTFQRWKWRRDGEERPFVSFYRFLRSSCALWVFLLENETFKTCFMFPPVLVTSASWPLAYRTRLSIPGRFSKEGVGQATKVQYSTLTRPAGGAVSIAAPASSPRHNSMNQKNDFKVEKLNSAAPTSLLFVPAAGRTLSSGRERRCLLASGMQTPLSHSCTQLIVCGFPAAESFSFLLLLLCDAGVSVHIRPYLFVCVPPSSRARRRTARFEVPPLRRSDFLVRVLRLSPALCCCFLTF